MENDDTCGDEGDKDKAIQLMIENKVLECEKKNAEDEVEVWKSKCMQLQLRVIELENALASTSYNSASGTPLANTPFKQAIHVDGGKEDSLADAKLEDRHRVRKSLAFPDEGNPSKKMAPSTPAGVRPSVGVINIDDSDDDDDDGKIAPRHSPIPIFLGCKLDCHSTDFGDSTLEENEVPTNSNSLMILGEQSNEDDEFGYEGNMSFIPTQRKKRSCNIVATDAENDDSDDAPISTLRKTRNKVQDPEVYLNKYDKPDADFSNGDGELTNGCGLKRLRKHGEQSVRLNSSTTNVSGRGRKYHLGITTDETDKNDDSEEEGSSYSDGNSLDGFIVSGSEVSENNAASDDDGASESDDALPSTECSRDSEEASHDGLDYNEIISQIRRDRHHKVEWEFEADMLAAFGKDPELCMRAACALYRQQTSEEKFAKGTFVHNGRGFSQCDALRGGS